MQFAPVYPLVYRLLEPRFSGCLWSGDPTLPEIALTIDDGPHPRYTPQLLEVLDRFQVTANFFWLGVSVERYPEVAQAVWQRGHWLGLHGYTHKSFTRLSASELRQSLEATQAAIARVCAIDSEAKQLIDVRPPNGLFTAQILRNLQQWGYRSVMWSVVPEDWVRPGVSVATRRVLKQTRNGSLIVLHDGYHGGADVAETAAELIPALLSQGYQFVTIDRLWQQRHSVKSTTV